MSTDASDEELEALRHATYVAGEMAVLPTRRDVPGLYAGEGDWMGGFPRLRCRLFGHSPRRLPLLDHEQETIGRAEVCDRCWRVLDTDEVIEA